MNVLGIETSCDETSVAIVRDGRFVLSNVVASQMVEHARYGGVVPEIASRRHVELFNTVLRQALSDAVLTLVEIDAIAVTNRPGLLGALLVGVTAAKGLAQACNLPLIGIHHIEAHLYANFLEGESRREVPPTFPAVALVVSGGHTDLFHLRGHGDYVLLGRTRDDAAGEAFDKCARLMGLGYPGGPAIQAAADGGNPNAIPFPRAYLDGGFEFSFSGLKTAVRRYMSEESVEKEEERREKREDLPLSPPTLSRGYPPARWDGVTPRGRRSPNTQHLGSAIPHLADIAASFQEAVVDVLVTKTMAAAKATGEKRVFLAGGVAANQRLREKMQVACEKNGLALFYPPPVFCTDNGAMIAATGYFHYQAGLVDDLRLTVTAAEPLAVKAS